MQPMVTWKSMEDARDLQELKEASARKFVKSGLQYKNEKPEKAFKNSQICLPPNGLSILVWNVLVYM